MLLWQKFCDYSFDCCGTNVYFVQVEAYNEEIYKY